MAKINISQTSSHGARLLTQKLLMSAAILTLAACAAPAGVTETQQSLETAGVPSVSASMLALADQLAGEHKYAAALPLYKRAHELDGDSETAMVGYANALLKTGQNTEALSAFEDAIGEFPRSAAALDGMGRAWMALGRPGVALPAFEAALARDPSNTSALNGKGVALAALGRNKDAISAFEDGLKLAPDDLALKNNYGLALTLDGQSDLGLPVLKEVVLDDRARAGHRQTLAMAYGVAGQTENARQMASIDLDLIDVDSEIAKFRTLASMPADKRTAAAMTAVRDPKLDRSKPANRVFLEPVEASATVHRLLDKPAVKAEVAPPPKPAPVKETLDIPPLDDNVGYAVQIAAYRHAAELNPGWKQLKAKYQNLIGNLEPRRSEVDFGQRDTDPHGFYYRLNAGPLKTFSAAKAICDAINADGGDCWVRPPLPTEGRVPVATAPQKEDSMQQAKAPESDAPETAAPAAESSATDSPAVDTKAANDTKAPETTPVSQQADIVDLPADATVQTSDDGEAWIPLDDPAQSANSDTAEKTASEGDAAKQTASQGQSTEQTAGEGQSTEQADSTEAGTTDEGSQTETMTDNSEGVPASTEADSAADYVWDPETEQYVAKEPTGVFASVPSD